MLYKFHYGILCESVMIIYYHPMYQYKNHNIYIRRCIQKVMSSVRRRWYRVIPPTSWYFNQN